MFYRVGVIHEVELKTGRARVRLPGQDNMVTWWLEVLTMRAHKDRVFWMPEAGEHVAVMLDERMEAGCILGAVYGGCHETPDGEAATADKAVMVAEDGARFEYDRQGHKLAITLPEGATVELVSDGGVTWSAKGGVTLDASDGGVSITGDVSVTGKLDVTGDASIGGNVTAVGNVSDATGSMAKMRGQYNGHKHGGAATDTPMD